MSVFAHEAEYICRWYNEDMLLDPYAPLVSGRRCFGVRDDIEEFDEKVFAVQQYHSAVHTTIIRQSRDSTSSADLTRSASGAHADPVR